MGEMWKETVVAYVRRCLAIFVAGVWKNHEKLKHMRHSDRGWSQRPHEYKSDALPLELTYLTLQ
jgi:hypothetical protein